MSTNVEEPLIAKSNDPAYIRNPLSKRFIKRGGATHKRLVSDGLLGQTRCINPVIATGTQAELELIKAKMLESGTLNLKRERLQISHGKLRRCRIPLTSTEISNGTKHRSLEAVMEHRDLVNSQMSSEMLETLMMKIVDMKIVGQTVDVDEEMKRMIALNRPGSPTPVNSPQIEPMPAYQPTPPIDIPQTRPKKKTRAKARVIGRFKLSKPPEFTDMSETDAYTDIGGYTTETETDY